MNVVSSDVIVVGAGLIGCAVAHALSRQGAAVLMIDAGAPGSGASQASAGMLCPHIEGSHDPILQQLGAESLARYDTFIHRVRSDSGMDVPYVRNGTLQVAGTDEAAVALANLAESLHAQGVSCQLAEGEAEVRELEPLVRPQRAGLLIQSHGAVRTRDLVEALLHASLHQGARCHQSERVERVAHQDRHVVVETHAHTFHAPHVVVTSGAWSMHLQVEGHPVIPTHPVRGQLLRLQMVDRGLRRVLWGPDIYMVPWADEVLVGATIEHVGFDARATVGGVSQLCAAAEALVPNLSDATFTEVRVGLRPGSPDGLPLIGASERMPGLLYATGHFRNGALLAPLTADLVTDLIRTSSAVVPPAISASRFDL
ncbi:Glycine oxidase [Luteitalea pratensis]|uniref:Glycine oxidase n=1 Tax=Luteitalea pratensis TaxID=1855912 RepID=A0A143PW22_LUTPR|nr:glycine oxidase ThiO [Luteitalea pratensis]AMY12782.1 Glycine oxidase [Luteitalea pratensis]